MDKLLQRTLLSSVILGSTLAITGCGSDSSSSPTPAPDTTPPKKPVVMKTWSGLVSDPAIMNSQVSLFGSQGDALAQAKTDEKGMFTFELDEATNTEGAYFKATAGKDIKTGFVFDDITFYAPVAAFDDHTKVVISPLTSLLGMALEDDEIAMLEEKLGVEHLLADPESQMALQKLALKVTLLLDAGVSVDDIATGLDQTAGLDALDLDVMLEDRAATKAELELVYSEFKAGDKSLIDTFIFHNIRSTLLEIAKIDLSKDDALPFQAKNNLDALVTHYLELAHENNRITLQPGEILASVAHAGKLSVDALSNEKFDVKDYPYVIEDGDVDDGADLSFVYYTVPNSLTGHSQLIAHNTATNTQHVLKNNMITGNRNFIFNGEYKNNKTVFHSRAYGLILDPNTHQETRTGTDYYGRAYEYQFSFDNGLLAYAVNNPSEEWEIFASEDIPADLKDKVKVIGKSFKVVDNLSDKANSYVQLTAYEELADPIRGEVSGDKLHTELTVRLSDGKAVQGRPVTLLKDAAGNTDKVLIIHEVPHTNKEYPEGEVNARHLKLCSADLETCNKLLDGDYYYTAKNDDYIYFTKKDSNKFFGFNITTEKLDEVSGVTFPALFDPEHHLLGASGHGAGVVLNNFSTLSNITTYIHKGDTAYAAINYDLDLNSPLGKFFGTRDINMPKNGQVVRFVGLEGVKMFDTGDGIDQMNESGGEAVGGHLNLIAAENDKLFVEIADIDSVEAGGQCEAQRGFYCFNVRYGYLNDDSQNKQDFDGQLAEKKGLKYLYVRRQPPFSLNGVLYINLMHTEASNETGIGHQYNLLGFDTATLEKASETMGRSYFTMTARYDDGRLEGEVIAWDAKTNELKNITRNTLIQSNVTGLANGAPVKSVLAQSNGLPIAGLGTVFALRVYPGAGDHAWYLVAGDADADLDKVQSIDQLPFSTWLYY